MRLKLTPTQLLLEFESIVTTDQLSRVNHLSTKSKAHLANGELPITRPAPVRHVQLQREKYGGFGFAIRSLPTNSSDACSSINPTATTTATTTTIVCAINRNSPADQSQSLFVGDRLLAINGQTTQHLNHDQIVRTLKQSGVCLNLLVQNNSFVNQPPTSGRWQAASRTRYCWCAPCTERFELEEERKALEMQTTATTNSLNRTPNIKGKSGTSVAFGFSNNNTPSGSDKIKSRFASPLRPFVRASAAYSSMIVTPSSKRVCGKENTPKVANTPDTLSMKANQSARRSVRFRSLWRSTCTSKQSAGSESSSNENSPDNANKSRSRSADRIDRIDPLHSLPDYTVTPMSIKPKISRLPDSVTERRLLSPLRAGAQPTCRTINLLHCQLTKFISCTDNVRRTSFELRWPNMDSNCVDIDRSTSVDCGSFCSALIHCSDSESAAELYHAFDVYIRLLRQQAVAGLNASSAPNLKHTHLFSWATVSTMSNTNPSISFASSCSSSITTPTASVPKSLTHSYGPWSPLYILLRGGQMQLWQQIPEALEHDPSTLAPVDLQVERQKREQFDRLGQLMSNHAVRCTFTCCCCAESNVNHNHVDDNAVTLVTGTLNRRSRRMRSTSSNLVDCATIAGHHSPDSTLGCSIGSSVSSSLALHQPLTPPPASLGSPSSKSLHNSSPINHNNKVQLPSLAPLHVLNACSTFIRRMRPDELPDRRTHCVQVQCAQPSLQFCLAFENEQQVLDLLGAWNATIYSSVQQLTRKSFSVMSDGRAGHLWLDWNNGLSFFEKGASSTPRWKFKFSQLRSSSDDSVETLWLSFATPGKSVETKRIRCADLKPLLFCMHAFLSSLLTATSQSPSSSSSTLTSSTASSPQTTNQLLGNKSEMQSLHRPPTSLYTSTIEKSIESKATRSTNTDLNLSSSSVRIPTTVA